jgi:xylulokinase
MSLMGIDVGTTGCKAASFSDTGELLSFAYEEYDVLRPAPGRAEMNPQEVWKRIARVIRSAAAGSSGAGIQAVSVSSLGEAVVPVGPRKEILGPSILNFDARGEEYLDGLREKLGPEELYRLNGNTLANGYTLPKLLWLRDHEKDMYRKTSKFLHWGSFVSFMLGAEPTIDYSLANRSLLFDMERLCWSQQIAERAGIDLDKLPRPVASATQIGRVSAPAAEETGLPAGVPVVSGAHDQCCNAVGAGVVGGGSAMCGMGTYLCIVPVFTSRPEPAGMIARGLNTEHHAAPGCYVSFLYNHGGSMVKWFRDTFARRDRDEAARNKTDIYDILFSEMPPGPGKLLVLPRFAPMGPPDFSTDAAGVIAGMTLETTRGEILRAVIEATAFHARQLVESIGELGVRIEEMHAVGGGSKSAAWVKICADVIGTPIVRPRLAEAGCLGAAIIAGVGCGTFGGFAEGVSAMVAAGDRIDPTPEGQRAYQERYERYRGLWPAVRDVMRANTQGD